MVIRQAAAHASGAHERVIPRGFVAFDPQSPRTCFSEARAMFTMKPAFNLNLGQEHSSKGASIKSYEIHRSLNLSNLTNGWTNGFFRRGARSRGVEQVEGISQLSDLLLLDVRRTRVSGDQAKSVRNRSESQRPGLVVCELGLSLFEPIRFCLFRANVTVLAANAGGCCSTPHHRTATPADTSERCATKVSTARSNLE